MLRKNAGHGGAYRGRPAPQVAHHHEDQDGVDGHGAGDRDAVGAGQIAGGTEAQHQPDHGEVQPPVDPRQIDLPDLPLGGVLDHQARAVAELDRLTGQRIGARDHRLGGDHGGQRGERNHRIERPVGRQMEEGMLDCRGLIEDQRALAEVVEHQRREHEPQPRQADGTAAEVAHVGIQRLGARHRQHHRAQRQEARSSRCSAKNSTA